jgi:hypothetical protein
LCCPGGTCRSDKFGSKLLTSHAYLHQVAISTICYRPSLVEAHLRCFRLAILGRFCQSPPTLRTNLKNHNVNMRTSLDIEAETPLLDKRAFSEVEVDPPSLETAFPVGKTPYVHAVRPVLTLLASWTSARKDNDGRRFPQTIAHRGYKTKYPENTLAAFKGAVMVGTNAIETDIHLSRDDVVVLSHVSHSHLQMRFGT